MTTPRDSDPILVGVGQSTIRSESQEEGMEPLEMMALAARMAEEDAETKKLLSRVDSVRVVNILSWRYPDPAGLLAERVGATPRERLYTTIGGNSPQWLVNETAGQIARGEVRIALLAGAEAFDTVRRAQRRGATLPWPSSGERPAMVGESRRGIRDVELQHGAAQAYAIYALFENALRAAKGRTVEEHQERLGRLFASFARVAADNPHAWFRDGKALSGSQRSARITGWWRSPTRST